MGQLLSTTTVNSFGITVPSATNDVKYVWLFHLLNNAPTPDRYISWFEKNARFSSAVRKIANEFKVNPSSFWEPDCFEKSDILQVINAMSENKGLSKIVNKLNYFFDKIRSLNVKKGHIITFSGVDGAGKSTVIDIISQRIEKELRQPVVVLRHRPSILPILSAWKYGKQNAEARSVSRLPRTGTNKSGFSSYLRFGYYYLDYLLGQFYIQIRYVQRGYVVLYDRYYFDFINDSKRSNIVVPESFASSLYKLLIKPEFNYFLYAPAEVILARKQELDAESIKMLTQKYLNLFSNLQQNDKTNTYKAISNIHLDNTLNIIFNNLKKSVLCSH
jgi:thymidylate kinase